MRPAVVELCVAGAAICGTPGSAAQAPPRLAFEVSVRVSSMDSNVRDLHRTTTTRVDRVRPIDMLPMEAFRERSFYRIAAPDWANEVMVEIQATMPEGASRSPRCCARCWMTGSASSAIAKRVPWMRMSSSSRRVA